jgi:hypothetical protein
MLAQPNGKGKVVSLPYQAGWHAPIAGRLPSPATRKPTSFDDDGAAIARRVRPIGALGDSADAAYPKARKLCEILMGPER